MTTIPKRNLTLRVGPSGGLGREWTQPLYIEAEIEKTIERHPNKAKIEIYNLSKSSADYCEQTGSICEIRAGEPTLSLVFRGDIVQKTVSTTRKGADLVTSIEAADGRRVYRDAQVALSYPAGTNREQIITDLISQAGLPLGFRANLSPKIYSASTAWYGTWREVLSQVLDIDAIFDIQNGSLRILAVNELQPGNAYLISEETGLHGAPKRTNKGVELTTKLIPGLLPGQGISIASRQIQADFKVTKIVHKINSLGSAWESKITARIL